MDIPAVTGFFSHISTDWIILAAFVVLFSLTVLRGGAKIVFTLALALPVAVLASQALPFANLAGNIVRQFATPPTLAVVFIVILAGTYFAVRRINISYDDLSGKPIQAFIAGCAITALMAPIWIATPTLGVIWHFGANAQSVFGEAWRFWWIAGPYAALAFTRG